MRAYPLLLGILFPLAAAVIPVIADDAGKIRQHLDGLRGMYLPKEKEKIDELNKRMDDAWAFIEAHKSASIPIVEAELKKALAEKAPDQFFLLDTGNLLFTLQGDSAASLGIAALEKLDPSAEIVQANWEEVFHFAMKLGATGRESARYLTQMDRLFLTNKTEIHFFRAPHMVQLNPSDIGSMVYGVTGEAGAQHLASMLDKTAPIRPHILQILRAVGSETEVPTVKALMESAKDYETLALCITFMMELGGPSGRAAVLALDRSQLEPAAKKYLDEVRPKAGQVSFAANVQILESLDKSTDSNSEIQRQLNNIEEHNGADNETSPAAVAKSGIPTDRLLAQMKRIRARTFRRETNHVFEDLEITNLLINTLQFRNAKH